jgi:hypothetical protein
MKRFIYLLTVVALLVIVGCDTRTNNPTEATDAGTLNKIERVSLPTSIILRKGSIVLPNGISYQTKSEIAVQLPKELWATSERVPKSGFGKTNAPPPLERDYYVNFTQNLFLCGDEDTELIFFVYNFPIDQAGQFGLWKHRPILVTAGLHPAFGMLSAIDDYQGPRHLNTNSPATNFSSGYAGTFYGAFSVTSAWYFDNDHDVDTVVGWFYLNGPGCLTISSFQGHLNGREDGR